MDHTGLYVDLYRTVPFFHNWVQILLHENILVTFVMVKTNANAFARIHLEHIVAVMWNWSLAGDNTLHCKTGVQTLVVDTKSI